MLTIPFEEAVRLFPDTLHFHETGVLPNDSLVRLKSKEIFNGKDTCIHLMFVCQFVWKSIACQFMQLEESYVENIRRPSND